MLIFPLNNVNRPINAKWIAPAGVSEEKNCYFRARKKFNIDSIPKSALLHIAAESYYMIYVNGLLIGRGPVRGTHTVNFFDTYNIADLLHKGENIISVLCLCMNIDTYVAAPAEPGVIIELENIISTDSSWEVQAANEWRQDVMQYSVQTGFCEWHDLRKTPIGWHEFEDNSNWDKACEIKINKELIPRDIPRLSEKEYFPVDIPVTALVPPLKDSEDIYIAKILTEEEHKTISLSYVEDMVIEPVEGGLAIVFNFDREIIGRFELDITAPAGTIVDLVYEEELWHNRLRADHISDEYNFADRYILHEGRQTIGNTLLERGFRMVQVVMRNFKIPVTIHKVKSIDSRYPFEAKASFHSSDPLLNKIWNVCSETISACTTDVFIDCPWRERAFWVNDMIVENKVALQLFGDPIVSARAFRLAFANKNDIGLLPGVCPAPQEDIFILLPTNLYMSKMLKDYYMYSGDIEMVNEFLPSIITIIDIFSGWINKKGLLEPPDKYWNFFDWSYGLNDIDYTGKVTSLLNFFYISAIKDCMELAEASGIKIEKQKYLKLLKKVKNGTDKYLKNGNYFIDSPDGISSQLAHALAFLTDEYKDDFILDALLDKNILIPEFFFHIFIFDALMKLNKADEALRRIRKYWGENVMTGTPTIWEAGIHVNGKKAFKESGSLCHGFATAPVDFIQTTIIGISPLKAGFKEFKVAPIPCGIEFANGSIPTPSGNIEISWEKVDEIIEVSLTVPKGLTAITAHGKFNTGSHQFELYM